MSEEQLPELEERDGKFIFIFKDDNKAKLFYDYLGLKEYYPYNKVNKLLLKKDIDHNTVSVWVNNPKLVTELENHCLDILDYMIVKGEVD